MSENNASSNHETCIVCLEEIEHPLACGHFVHEQCVARAGQNRCSVCRAEVTWSEPRWEQLYQSHRQQNEMETIHENLQAARSLAANGDHNVINPTQVLLDMVQLFSSSMSIGQPQQQPVRQQARPQRLRVPTYLFPTLQVSIPYEQAPLTNDMSEIAFQVSQIMHYINDRPAFATQNNGILRTNTTALHLANMLLLANRVQADSGLSFEDVLSILQLNQ